ncbi:MAG TPA: carboxymuconolactone decarboxylase family protein [Solimonas sp.]
MPRIDVADDLGSWMQLAPDRGEGLIAFSQAVYGKSTLPMRERELARMRIAQINECEVCRNARQGQGAAHGVDEALYANAAHWRTHAGYSAREQLAAEFAERFAQDHVAMRADEAFWIRLRAAYSDAEIVELGLCCALWLGAGRLQRVLDVGQSCQLVL